MRTSWVMDGAIALAVGLAFAALGTECLATFNACFANPSCYPSGSALPLAEFFALLVVGIAISIAGAVQLAVGLRTVSRVPLT